MWRFFYFLNHTGSPPGRGDAKHRGCGKVLPQYGGVPATPGGG